MPAKKIVIIDTSYLIFKSFFGYPNLNKGETPTGAFFGFAKTILALSKKLNTKHFLFAKDLPTPTWRHKLLTSYKAGRPELAPELKTQFPIISNWIESITASTFTKEGFEADDIIKTICDHAILENEENEIYIFSSDRDLYQLFINPDIKFIHGDEFFDVNQFKVKYEVEPFQWIDYKSYVGDNSDNLKGVSGVGPKTAAKLLAQNISLDNIYEYELKKQNETIEKFISENEKNAKLIEKILSEIETVKQTQHLATLQFVEDLPLNLDLEINLEGGLDLFNQYNFTSLVKQVSGGDTGKTAKIVEENNSEFLF